MTKETAPLKPASTVLLVRDCEKTSDTVEVFMVVRHHQIDFASGALVFPGGKVDPADSQADLSNHLPARQNTEDKLLAFKVAAIRESFEECNILLARDKTSGELVGPEQLELLVSTYRKKMQSGEIDILTMAAQENLELATDLLAHYSHWLTPTFMPKRFDTHFFIARAPQQQLAIHDGEESVDSVWIGPNEAKTKSDEGTYTIIFPTLMNLEYLSKFSSAAQAVDAANGSATVSVLPEIEITELGKFLNIPAEAGYSVTRHPIDPIMDPGKKSS